MFLLDGVEDYFDIQSLSCPVYFITVLLLLFSLLPLFQLTWRLKYIFKIEFKRKNPLQSNLQGAERQLSSSLHNTHRHPDWDDIGCCRANGSSQVFRPGLSTGAGDQEAIRWISSRWVKGASQADHVDYPSQANCQTGETDNRKREGNRKSTPNPNNLTPNPNTIHWHYDTGHANRIAGILMNENLFWFF